MDSQDKKIAKDVCQIHGHRFALLGPGQYAFCCSCGKVIDVSEPSFKKT